MYLKTKLIKRNQNDNLSQRLDTTKSSLSVNKEIHSKNSILMF